MRNPFDRLAGTLVSLASVLGQRAVPYWPRERLVAQRDRNVRATISYAASQVPYYRGLLRALHIDPRSIRTAEDLSLLPLLDKETIRRDPRAFVADNAAGRSAWRFVTSGTTGVALEIYHDRLSALRNTGYNRREDAVLEYFAGPRRKDTLSIGYQGGTFDTYTAHLAQTRLGVSTRGHRSVTVLDPLERVLEALNALRPAVLSSYGSYLDAFFRIVVSQGHSFHRPSLVKYGGDGLSEEGRHLIETELGIPVVSRYNAVEVFKIGFSCEHGPHYHVHEDLTHVRLVGPDGQDVPTGQRGQVVVSDLINRGMVLINYQLGDLASWHSDPCPCGRTMARLSQLEGRIEDIIVLSGGGFVHPRAVWKALKYRQGIIRYQLIQHDLDMFELRLATSTRETYDAVIGSVLADLRTLLGHRASIESTYQREWQPMATPGGYKFRPVVSFVRKQLIVEPGQYGRAQER